MSPHFIPKVNLDAQLALFYFVLIKPSLTGFSIAPIDEPASFPDLPKLVNLFGIPNDFVAEKFHAVTHSFGTRKLRDDSESTCLKQFLKNYFQSTH